MKSYRTFTVISNLILMVGGLTFAGIACKKAAPPQKIEITPLQTLVNTDTTLTLYHLMILRANDVALLNDSAATLLFPRNAVLIRSGYNELFIDSMSSAMADRIVRYNYLPGGLAADSAGYTANPTLLGVPLYVWQTNNNQLLLNGSIPLANQPAKVGLASVYYLDSIVPPAADSLPVLMQADSTLTFMNEVLVRTNLYDSLLLTGSYTLLAPSNTAFQQAGWDSVGAIDSANVDTLLNLAMNQVMKGSYFTSTFPTTMTTLQGAGVTVSTSGGMLQFAGGGNTVPVNWLSGNQVAGPTVVLHHTDGIIKP